MSRSYLSICNWPHCEMPELDGTLLPQLRSDGNRFFLWVISHKTSKRRKLHASSIRRDSVTRKWPLLLGFNTDSDTIMALHNRTWFLTLYHYLKWFLAFNDNNNTFFIDSVYLANSHPGCMYSISVSRIERVSHTFCVLDFFADAALISVRVKGLWKYFRVFFSIFFSLLLGFMAT